jgi:hypothetical protein
MIQYAISIASFQTKNLDSILHVFATPALSNLVFPAELPVAPKKSIFLSDPSDFKVSMIPKEFISTDGLVACIPLYCKNGLRFHATLYLNKKTIIPNMINIEFTSDHLTQTIITLPVIKSLLKEVIPVFEADQASVYDTYLQKIPHKGEGFGFEKINYFQNKDGLYYQLKIGWVNYFGPRMLKDIGEERFHNLHACLEKSKLHEGILAILQEEPVDNSNPDHVARRNKAEEELEFRKLRKD